MKRAILCELAGISEKKFENLSARDYLPFPLPSARWSDYDLKQALQVRILAEAGQVLPGKLAALLAREAIYAVAPSDPFSNGSGEPLFAALVALDLSFSPGAAQTVIGGKWNELIEKAESYRRGLIETRLRGRETSSASVSNAWVESVHAVDVTGAAQRIIRLGYKLKLDEVKMLPPPDDLNELLRNEGLKQRSEFNGSGREEGGGNA
jgi:hypothetical protein